MTSKIRSAAASVFWIDTLTLLSLLAGPLMKSRYVMLAVPALWTGLERTHGTFGFAWLALGNAGDFHQQRCQNVRARYAPKRRHAAAVDALGDGEAVDHCAWLNRKLRHAHLPIERRSASQCGKPFSRIRIAAVSTS